MAKQSGIDQNFTGTTADFAIGHSQQQSSASKGSAFEYGCCVLTQNSINNESTLAEGGIERTKSTEFDHTSASAAQHTHHSNA